MPCAVDYILEGLAKNLELKRELGEFSVEFDRDFLARLPKDRETKSEVGSEVRSEVKPKEAAKAVKALDFVFLHHAAVAGPGIEMMAKIVAAMKKTPEAAPIVFTGEKPAARIYVVLGMKALAKWYPGLSLSHGGWSRDGDSEVLLVYSPEDIYRFGTNLSAAMVQKKREMWKSLQEVMRKVKSEE